MSKYTSIGEHRAMIFDPVRNSAYTKAIKDNVNPNTVLLDLGSGLGIHGLVAAKSGAARVYLVDPSPISAIAEKLAASEGVGDRVVCLQQGIENAELPEKVDTIVSVFTGNFLLSEDLLPLLFLARDKFLKPGGKLIPDFAEMRVVPVQAGDYYQRMVDQWTIPSQEVDFSLLRKVAANALYFGGHGLNESTFLAEPGSIANVDFYTARKAECHGNITFRIDQQAECHGFLGWFRMRLGESWLSTSPRSPTTHWSQVFMPLEQPFPVEAGQLLDLAIDRPQHGEWTWTATYQEETRRQSTFFSEVMSRRQLQNLSPDFRPTLSQEGRIMEFVLGKVSSGLTNREILESSREFFAVEAISPEELDRKVRSILLAVSN